MDIKQFIQNSRNKGISDEETFKYLRNKGLISNNQIKYNSDNNAQTNTQNNNKTTSNKSLIESIGDFLGVGGLAKGITASVLSNTDKEYNRIIKKMNSGKSPTEGELSYVKSISGQILNTTSKEVLGSSLQTAATIGTMGIGAGKILPALTKVGVAGATVGAGKAIEENKTTEETLKQAFTTGLTSAATYGVISSIGKLGKLALEKLPSKLYNSVVKIGKESADTMLNEKQIGTLGKLKAISDNEVSKLNESISNKITKESGSFNSKEFIDKIYKSIKSDWQGYSKEKILKSIEEAGIDPFLKNKTVDYEIANNVRKGIGETLGTVWKTDNPKFNQSIRIKIWKEISNTIKSTTNTEEDFSRLATYTKASIKLGKIINNQSEKFNISLYDILGGGFGYAGGGLTGAAIGAVGRRVVENPLLKTGTAVGLNELNKIIEKLPIDKAGKISKTLLINAFKNLQ